MSILPPRTAALPRVRTGAARGLALAASGLLVLTACTSDPEPAQTTSEPTTTTSSSPVEPPAPEETEETEETVSPSEEPDDAETEPEAEPSATPPGDAVAALTLRGGMCSDGTECETSLVVERDGSWTRSEQGVVVGTGEVHPADLEWWSTVGPDLDPDSLVAGEATACPRDSDGTEVVLETLTSDGWVTLESCEVELADSEVLERLGMLLEATEF